MKKEQLLKEGFTEEQATKILDMYLDAIKNKYVPNHRFNELNEELKSAKEQLSDRDTQIKALKKFEGDATALQEKIKELEKTNADKAAEYEAKMTSERKRNAVRMALLEDENGKPFDSDLVLGMLNLDNIVLDEAGKITSGFKEQNDNLRKNKSFLFEQKVKDNRPDGMKFKGNTPPDGDPNKTPDTSENYGKSLAAVKLGMMGISADAE